MTFGCTNPTCSWRSRSQPRIRRTSFPKSLKSILLVSRLMRSIHPIWWKIQTLRFVRICFLCLWWATFFIHFYIALQSLPHHLYSSLFEIQVLYRCSYLRSLQEASEISTESRIGIYQQLLTSQKLFRNTLTRVALYTIRYFKCFKYLKRHILIFVTIGVKFNVKRCLRN